MAARVAAGRTTGFDYLRIGLAVAVVCVHGNVTSFGPSDHGIFAGLLRPLVVSTVPMFFALSGFLVTGSLLRAKSVTEFLMLRASRIVPALFVEVSAVAFLLGPLLTSVPLQVYFTDREFLSYPLNIVGDIHYRLPGLFLANPDADMVNRQLWTIPSELRCYAAILVLALLGIVRSRKLMLAVLAVGLAGFPVFDALFRRGVWEFDNVPLKALVLCFLTGAVFFLYRDRIRLNPLWFVLSLGLAYALLLAHATSYFAAVPVTYATLYLGLSRPPKTILTATGDYSYGLYLYGYPIQQAYSDLFPDHRVWWLNILATLVCGGAFGALSWHFVEAPVRARRRRVVTAAETAVATVLRLLARRRGTPIEN